MYDQIRTFLENQCLFEFNDEITQETNLFKEGLMDSYSFIELINYLENNFDVKFQQHELLASNFCSLNAILKNLARCGEHVEQ